MPPAMELAASSILKFACMEFRPRLSGSLACARRRSSTEEREIRLGSYELFCRGEPLTETVWEKSSADVCVSALSLFLAAL